MPQSPLAPGHPRDVRFRRREELRGLGRSAKLGEPPAASRPGRPGAVAHSARDGGSRHRPSATHRQRRGGDTQPARLVRTFVWATSGPRPDRNRHRHLVGCRRLCGTFLGTGTGRCTDQKILWALPAACPLRSSLRCRDCSRPCCLCWPPRRRTRERRLHTDLQQGLVDVFLPPLAAVAPITACDTTGGIAAIVTAREETLAQTAGTCWPRSARAQTNSRGAHQSLAQTATAMHESLAQTAADIRESLAQTAQTVFATVSQTFRAVAERSEIAHRGNSGRAGAMVRGVAAATPGPYRPHRCLARAGRRAPGLRQRGSRGPVAAILAVSRPAGPAATGTPGSPIAPLRNPTLT